MSFKRILFVALMIAVLVPTVSNATVSRVMGMGGVEAGYILIDASNPSIWPQRVKVHPYIAGAEFNGMSGGWTFDKIYCNYAFGDDKSVVGFALDNRPNRDYSLAPAVPTPDGGTMWGAPNKLSINYGRPMGDNMLIGLGLGIYGHSWKTTDANGGVAGEANHSVFSILLGFSELENKIDLSLGIETASWKEESGGTVNNESDGAMAIVFNGRWWYDYADDAALIPNIRFLTMTDGAKAGNNSGKISTTDIKLGCGHNWTPAENALVIFEFGLEMYGMKSESEINGVSTDATDSYNHLPYWRLGFETQIFSWLNGRAGGEKTWMSGTLESVPGEPDYGTAETALYLGATAHWNRLYLDFLVNPYFLSAGPDFISGTPSGPLANRLSLWYNFKK